MSPRQQPRPIHGADHYENFPVASCLVPAAIRPAVLSLYRFARAGDDLADEGSASPADRQRDLHVLSCGLLGAQLPADRTEDPKAQQLHALGADLARHLRFSELSLDPALRLLEAFYHDADFRPFAQWSDVMAYCYRSANPVGELMLGLFGAEPLPDEVLVWSNAICSGLQLVNFAQDLAEDLERGRPTLPQSDWPVGWVWVPAPVSGHFEQTQPLSDAEKTWITTQMTRRGQRLLAEGKPLVAWVRHQRQLPDRWRLALEIATIRQGGLAMANRLIKAPLAPWTAAPRLGLSAFLGALLRALPEVSFAPRVPDTDSTPHP